MKMIFFSEKPKWLTDVKLDLKHFYDMAKLSCFCKKDKIQFWEYIKAYAEKEIESEEK